MQHGTAGFWRSTVSTSKKSGKKRGAGFGCVDFCILKKKRKKKRGPDVGAPAHKITVLEYVIFSMFQISQTSKSMFSSFEILKTEIVMDFKFRNPGFRNLKNRTISVFSEVFQRQTQRKKQRDKTMESINGNTVENTKENTWSVFNDFPCGYDKSQRLLTRNSEKKSPGEFTENVV